MMYGTEANRKLKHYLPGYPAVPQPSGNVRVSETRRAASDCAASPEKLKLYRVHELSRMWQCAEGYQGRQGRDDDVDPSVQLYTIPRRQQFRRLEQPHPCLSVLGADEHPRGRRSGDVQIGETEYGQDSTGGAYIVLVFRPWPRGVGRCPVEEVTSLHGAE